MKINQIISETITAGSVASVAAPMGKVQKRAGSMFKGKKTNKPFYEAELQEDDLILVPGQGHKLKSGFISHDMDRRDHEVEMARSDLYNAAKNAKEIYQIVQHVSEDEGLEGWVQEKIIKANDYLNSVREYLEHKVVQQESNLGGVVAGGIAAEGVAESLDRPREAGKAIQSLKNLAIMKTSLTMQQLSQAGKEAIVSNAINAAKTLEQTYLQNKQQGNAIFIRALRDEIDNFMRGAPINASFPESDTASELGDLLQGKLGKVNFQQGVAEGAKVDRMVKHIEKSERKLGKSKDEAENIAWATVNKRGYLDNKNKKKAK